MFRIQSWTDSTPRRGTIPQGKGREGIRKGSGAERYRYASCGYPNADQIQSHRYLPALAAPIGFGAVA